MSIDNDCIFTFSLGNFKHTVLLFYVGDFFRRTRQNRDSSIPGVTWCDTKTKINVRNVCRWKIGADIKIKTVLCNLLSFIRRRESKKMWTLVYHYQIDK